MNYREMYLALFRAITDAVEKINKCDVLAAKEALMTAQQKTEEMYIKDGR